MDQLGYNIDCFDPGLKGIKIYLYSFGGSSEIFKISFQKIVASFEHYCVCDSKEALRFLEAYFSGKDLLIGLPEIKYLKNDLKRQKLYEFLVQSKKGEIFSYSELAQKLYGTNSPRYLGTLLKKNPLPVLIPCHRVIRKDGQIGVYSGGDYVKRALIKFEAAK